MHTWSIVLLSTFVPGWQFCAPKPAQTQSPGTFCATISNMLKPVSFILFLFLTIFCNAQGSWNIGYIKVDSISQKHVGQIVRVDFRSSNPSIRLDVQRGIRSYVGMKDTGILTIDTISYVLAERRKIYVDHGSYDDQYLECLNCKQQMLLIYDAKIIGVDEKSILFLLNIEFKSKDHAIDKQNKIARIDRGILDGVILRL